MDYEELRISQSKPLLVTENDLRIIKEALELQWETHRPEGDEEDLYSRVLAAL